MLSYVSLDERNGVLPDYPAKEHSRSHRRTKAVRTNDSILDTATIDATGGHK